jgi:hypothetical protein
MTEIEALYNATLQYWAYEDIIEFLNMIKDCPIPTITKSWVNNNFCIRLKWKNGKDKLNVTFYFTKLPAGYEKNVYYMFYLKDENGIYKKEKDIPHCRSPNLHRLVNYFKAKEGK